MQTCLPLAKLVRMSILALLLFLLHLARFPAVQATPTSAFRAHLAERSVVHHILEVTYRGYRYIHIQNLTLPFQAARSYCQFGFPDEMQLASVASEAEWVAEGLIVVVSILVNNVARALIQQVLAASKHTRSECNHLRHDRGSSPLSRCLHSSFGAWQATGVAGQTLNWHFASPISGGGDGDDGRLFWLGGQVSRAGGAVFTAHWLDGTRYDYNRLSADQLTGLLSAWPLGRTGCLTGRLGAVTPEAGEQKTGDVATGSATGNWSVEPEPCATARPFVCKAARGSHSASTRGRHSFVGQPPRAAAALAPSWPLVPSHRRYQPSLPGADVAPELSAIFGALTYSSLIGHLLEDPFSLNRWPGGLATKHPLDASSRRHPLPHRLPEARPTRVPAEPPTQAEAARTSPVGPPPTPMTPTPTGPPQQSISRWPGTPANRDSDQGVSGTPAALEATPPNPRQPGVAGLLISVGQQPKPEALSPADSVTTTEAPSTVGVATGTTSSPGLTSLEKRALSARLRRSSPLWSSEDEPSWTDFPGLFEPEPTAWPDSKTIDSPWLALDSPGAPGARLYSSFRPSGGEQKGPQMPRRLIDDSFWPSSQSLPSSPETGQQPWPPSAWPKLQFERLLAPQEAGARQRV
ncbi:unnamed protein product [Protopolystoma xenopodis]|uniref:C-type lectin domain-containing protein n=1 Tax=Protopolystoma xenopodis TaxID=117903 RepID=A0A3S4ZY89_9PLAT|nr:unnamed protein product [Protopolystoma xenopodis]